MGIWVQEQLISVGVTDTQLVELGDQPNTNPPLQLPPLVAARLGTDSSRKTVFIYGHYDVQPVSASCRFGYMRDRGSTYPLRPQADPTSWQEQNPESPDPFHLTRVQEGGTDKLVGRGSTDDKGPVVGWLNVLEAHQKLGLELPVNVRFLFEGMEESGSVGLDDWIKEEAAKGEQGFFAGIDCVCIVSISGQFELLLAFVLPLITDLRLAERRTTTGSLPIVQRSPTASGVSPTLA